MNFVQHHQNFWVIDTDSTINAHVFFILKIKPFLQSTESHNRTTDQTNATLIS